MRQLLLKSINSVYGGVEPVDAIALSLRHKNSAALRESRQDCVN